MTKAGGITYGNFRGIYIGPLYFGSMREVDGPARQGTISTRGFGYRSVLGWRWAGRFSRLSGGWVKETPRVELEALHRRKITEAKKNGTYRDDWSLMPIGLMAKDHERQGWRPPWRIVRVTKEEA